MNLFILWSTPNRSCLRPFPAVKPPKAAHDSVETIQFLREMTQAAKQAPQGSPLRATPTQRRQRPELAFNGPPPMPKPAATGAASPKMPDLLPATPSKPKIFKKILKIFARAKTPLAGARKI